MKLRVAVLNQEDNAVNYNKDEKDEVKTINKRIKQAAKKHGVEISAD